MAALSVREALSERDTREGPASTQVTEAHNMPIRFELKWSAMFNLDALTSFQREHRQLLKFATRNKGDRTA